MKLFVSTFWGTRLPPEQRGYPRHELSPWLLIVPALLLLPQVIGGVAPGWFIGSVLEPGTEWHAWIAVWHHLDKLTALSVITLGLGTLGYLFWRTRSWKPPEAWTLSGFDDLARLVVTGSDALGRAAQAGGHPRYVATALLFAALAASLSVAMTGEWAPSIALLMEPWSVDLAASVFPALVVAAGAVIAVAADGRITKIIAMAVAGYGLAVLYVLFRAPDLVLTQILVETISLVLLLLVFRRLPAIGPDKRTRGRRFSHTLVAVVIGASAAALAWASGAHSVLHPAGAEQLALAVPEGKGRNVVNVILVDFRGADTLGEITVLAIAAIGVVALLTGRRRAAGRGGA